MSMTNSTCLLNFPNSDYCFDNVFIYDIFLFAIVGTISVICWVLGFIIGVTKGVEVLKLEADFH